VRSAAPTDLVATTAPLAPKLNERIDIPDDADCVTGWIPCERPSGETLYDSSFGRNFRFRFCHDELRVLQSDVLHDAGSPLGRLVVRVATNAQVERVLLRYQVLTDPLAPSATQVELRRSDGADAQGHTSWETPDVRVPADRVVAYDFVYFTEGRPFKDKNQGKSFLAVDPAKRLPPAVEDADGQYA
jgi:hypothetical protein